MSNETMAGTVKRPQAMWLHAERVAYLPRAQSPRELAALLGLACGPRPAWVDVLATLEAQAALAERLAVLRLSGPEAQAARRHANDLQELATAARGVVGFGLRPSRRPVYVAGAFVVATTHRARSSPEMYPPHAFG